MPKYQTLSEFLREPFGQSDDREKLSKYNMMYTMNQDKIELVGYTQIDKSYYFHVKIPSKSQKEENVFYDVVIRFFTDKKDALNSSHLRDYYIQFFSNSPGFIYNYAYVYRTNGFLIEFLYKKLDPEYFDKLPEKRHAELKLSYDKSIYFACRFLSEKKFRVLNKFGAALSKKLSPDKFFKGIRDFQSIKLESELISIERRSLKDLDRALNDQIAMEKNNKRRELDQHRKKATTSTMKNRSIHTIGKKIASNSTSKSIRSITIKTSRKSTRKT